MSSTIGSVVAASATANAKVFLIGIVGLVSTKYPRDAPLIPPEFVDPLARMNFFVFMIPLVYSSLASAITVEEIKTLWIVPLSAVVLISLSYVIATVLGYLPCFRLNRHSKFDALRIATAFPNIVALPVLIFPSICEYPIAYKQFGAKADDDTMTSYEMYEQCVAKSSSMIFLYFFGFNIVFWTFAVPKLMQSHNPANNHHHFDQESDALSSNKNSTSITSTISTNFESESTDVNQIVESSHNTADKNENKNYDHKNSFTWIRYWLGIKKTITSPGFVAMILGIITAFIPPLQKALFQPGGSLRFMGGALEGLGQTTTIVGTIVVATSLVAENEQLSQKNEKDYGNNTLIPSENKDTSDINVDNDEGLETEMQHHDDHLKKQEDDVETCGKQTLDEKTRHRSSFRQIVSSLRSSIQSIKRKEDLMKISIWYIVTRLIVTPAATCALIIGLDCSGALSSVPHLFKLVIIVNSSLPGALIIVVILKTKKELKDVASLVTQIYLPCYLVSIITTAVWTSIGLWISTPKSDGTSSFCFS